MHILYSILILSLFLSICLAGPTIIVTGSAEKNAAKFEFLGRYVPQSVLKNDQLLNANILIYNTIDVFDSLIEDSQSVHQTCGIPLVNNVSTIVFTGNKFEDFNSEELEVLKRILRTNRALYVVEFDEYQCARLVLLEHANCWAISKIYSESHNRVFHCNKETDDTPFETVKEKTRLRKTITNSGSAFFYVSAASKKYRLDKKKMEEELEDEIQDIVEESMKTVEKRMQDKDDDDDDNEFDNKHDPKRDHRLHCKYRKSCYETGKRGLIEPYDISFNHLFHFWRAPASQQHHLPRAEDADQDGIPDSEDDDVNLADRKLVCKYRTACYKEHNIPLSDKQQERERSFMTAKLQAPQGKKRTLKDIAQKAVSGVKEREEEVKVRPVPKSLIVEKKLQEIENQLKKKLDCKYRKSCYETGEVPDIEDASFSIPFLFSKAEKEDNNDDDDEETKPFEEMEDLEKKHYCKYRKSCYETGEKPEIESELSIESFHDILEMPDIVETRKLSLQERCKYRKSCYETGILPDLSSDDEHIEKVINKEVSSVVPSTVQGLKTLCKYRKSCYQEISESSSSDIVQTIRKRRLIEKEVRKRRTRRHRRLHKRRAMMTRYGMTTGSTSKYDKVEKTQKELQDIADARENRKDAVIPKSIKIHGKKKVSKVVEDVAEEPIVATEAIQQETPDDEETEPELPKPKKNKRSLKKAQEPEVEDISEPEPVKKSKKSKTVKVIEPEPEDEKEQEPEPIPEPVKKLKKSLKKSKAADLEDHDESESIPVPVPIPAPKKSRKSLKDEKEQEPEKDDDSDEENQSEASAKLSKAIPTASEDVKDEDGDDDDDGNEFDNQHDPKRDHRLHCKYRKTCYETGKKGLIEAYDFSLWHLVHFWAAPPSQQHHNYGKHKDSDGDGVPDVEDKDAAMADRKLSCKYRPSCYEKYEIPVGEKVLEREQKRTVKSESSENEDDDDADDDEERKINLNAADRRLECKYRRSCYDSGVLPSIQQWSDAPTLSEAIELNSKNLKMQKCKYRKSCYEAAGITDKEEEKEKGEDMKTPHIQEKLKPVESSTDRHHHSKHGKKKHQEQKDSDEDNDSDEEEQEKPKKNKEEKKEEAKVHEQSDKETLEQGGKEISLSVAEKSWCKYRKSCYSSVEPKAAKQDHSGSMARRAGSGQKCHIYYLSCREAMGLSPKEKAPMGPNGKRLCRKVKKDN